VKRPALIIIGLAFALAGCSGSSNTANQASSDTNAAAPAESSAPAAQAPSGAPPVYPGAKKSTLMGQMNSTKCGHKGSVSTYTTSDNLKTVLAWYTQQMPGGIQIDAGHTIGHGLMTSIEIFNPDGASAVGVTQPNAAAMGGKAQPVYIGVGTYDPPLSADEMHTMQDIMGTDPAAKQKAIAAMKAKCGPASVKAFE
jgi:Prokaryotic membrane lipoprotein lipid attachment site